MKQLQKQKENKAAILEDMLACISYTPNREQDILAFMEQYQKSDNEHRPSILEHLRACIDGGEYPNPYAGNYRYTLEDVARCGEILDNFIDGLMEASGASAAVAFCTNNAVTQLNELNDRCYGCLVDTWRRERLCVFISTAAELAGAVQEADLALEHRMW